MTPLNGAKPLVREYVDADGTHWKVAIDEVGVWFCPVGHRTWRLATLEELFNSSVHYPDKKPGQIRPGPVGPELSSVPRG